MLVGAKPTDLTLLLQNRKELQEKAERERILEQRSYKSIMKEEKMTSNKDIAAQGRSFKEIEDDFM